MSIMRGIIHRLVLFLTECDITFGRFIGIDHLGDFKGSLKLSLAPGSLLMMEGKSADFAKHALPSVRKQRVLVTFTNYQQKKSMSRPPSPSVSQSSQRGPPSSRSPNHFRHSSGPKHYAAIPTTGVLLATGIPPQIPPRNVVQPLFVPTPVCPCYSISCSSSHPAWFNWVVSCSKAFFTSSTHSRNWSFPTSTWLQFTASTVVNYWYRTQPSGGGNFPSRKQ